MNRSVISNFLILLLSVSCSSIVIEREDDGSHFDNRSLAVRSRSASETEDLYFVSQRMAELFISSQKSNPRIVGIEPYEMEGVVCLYVINFENGYKIVSADTRTQPVLAACEEGVLHPGETDNPGVKVWLEDTADRIRFLKKYNPEVKEDYSDLWSPFRSYDSGPIPTRAVNDSLFFDEDLIWIRVVESSVLTSYCNANQSALMTTKWGQGSPWNAAAPLDYVTGMRCVTGCAAVAVSQVLRYFNKKGSSPTDLWHTAYVSSTTPHFYPIFVDGNTYYQVFVTTTLTKSWYTSNSSRWGKMPDTQTGSHTEYVARLMLDIGNRVDMQYSQVLSVVVPDTLNYTYSIPNLPQCGISSSYAPFHFPSAAMDIQSKKPVIISAYCDPAPSGGHVWVMDGCHDLCQIHTTTETFYCISPEDYYSYSNIVDVYTVGEMMSINPNVYHGMQTTVSSTHTYKDLHMNWGSDGDGDGYYNMLNSDDWILPSGDTTLNFLYERRMHYNISTSQIN